jgi:succinate-semialdehyde dehydrogenase/glutarate-semialdehyde dehydrogenase
MTELTQVRLLVAGEWQDGADQADVLDKYLLKPYARMHIASQAQVREAVAAAHAAYAGSTLTAYDRGAILDRAAAIIERDGEKFVDLLRTEAGFTLFDAQGELRRCIQTFRLSAEEARRLVGEVVPLEGAPQQAGRIASRFPCRWAWSAPSLRSMPRSTPSRTRSRRPSRRGTPWW